MESEERPVTLSPPQSPLWQVTEAPPIPADAEIPQQTLQKRQSLRLRPSEILENAEPSSPLNLSSKSTPKPPPLTSKMSLFSLFNRPNVERQRGYAERGIDVAPTENPISSKSDLVIQVQPENAPPRPASILSGKTTATKWTKFKPKPRPPTPRSKERKPGSFEPPPLFQAYPQSTKDGTLEISSISVETLNKAKSKSTAPNATLSEKAAGDRSSSETKRTSALKYIPNGSAATVELPKKVFVLVTSGYLLQYAERGASDRLPEKILHLGKDSAAFACDLVPGKHYVLQVSQAVDQDGIIVANSGSIFSKLGIRSAAAKRMTSNLILVMPNADEMESWMSALRLEIEALGGKKVRHYTVRRKAKEASESTTDLKRTPSQSHRYQVKRNPSMVSSVSSPKPYQLSFPPVLPDIDLDRSDRSTIDEIEWEATVLNHYLTASVDSSTNSSQAPLELPAVTSSPVAVVEQPLPEKPEKTDGSPNGSVHISPAKHTVAAPNWKARTNSSTDLKMIAINSGQTAPDTVPETETISTSSSPARPISTSHNFSRKSPPAPLILNSQTVATRRPLVEESPIIPNYPLLSKRISTRLTNAYAERNFADTVTAIMPAREKHDSKVSNALSVSVNTTEEESHDSTAPTKDIASYELPSLRASPPPQVPTANIEPNKNRRVASFSMPLKVNPTATNGSSSSGNVRRHSRMDEGCQTGEGKVGYALTPPVDSSNLDSSSYFQPDHPPSSADSHKHSPPHSSSGRLSLFPSPRSSHCMASNETLKRSISGSMRQSNSQPVMNGGTLKRPTSLQVRSDHAPFLSSVRNSTGNSDPHTAMATVPIRGMKPSRSASNVAALAQQNPSTIEEFKALKFDTPTLEEEVDFAMPLPVETPAPPKTTKPSSRNSVRKSLKGRSALPDLDFGIPVVGLGPPAPPPQAPLPAPPPISRTTSPIPLQPENVSIDTVAGLGISVS